MHQLLDHLLDHLGARFRQGIPEAMALWRCPFSDRNAPSGAAPASAHSAPAAGQNALLVRVTVYILKVRTICDNILDRLSMHLYIYNITVSIVVHAMVYS